MIPDRLQYFLDDCWNFQNFVKIWTRIPPNYYKNALNHTRNLEPAGNIIFAIIGLTKLVLGKMKVLGTGFLFEYLILIIFGEDDDRKMMTIGQIKSTRSWI